MDVLIFVYLIIFLLFCLSFKCNDKQKNSIPTDTYSLRGLLCLIIIFLHIIQTINTNGNLSTINFLCVIGNGIFFFLSGYGVFKKHINDSKYKDSFLKSRIKKVLIPYLLITFIYIIIKLEFKEQLTLKIITLNMFNGFPIVKYSWFIIHILLFYFFFWVAINLFRQKHIYTIIGMFIVYFYSTIIIVSLKYESCWLYCYNHLLIVGMLWALYEKDIMRIINKKYYQIVSILLIVFVISLLASYKIDSYINDYYLCYILFNFLSSTIYTLLLIILQYRYNFYNKLLNFLGNISMEMYLFHGLFIYIFLNSQFKIKNDYLYLFIIVLSTICISFIFNRLYKKVISKRLKNGDSL